MLPIYQGNPYAIDENEWNLLIEFLRSNNIRSVIEFGVGISTKLFLAMCSRVVSYEHDQDWASKFDHDVILYDPMKPIQYIDEKFDLAFVDGPNGKFRIPDNCSRYYTTEAAKKHSDIIIIHDSKRDGETETIRRLLSDWQRQDLPSARGLTIFRRKG